MLVIPRSDRTLTPDRRRIIIRWQSGGGSCTQRACIAVLTAAAVAGSCPCRLPGCTGGGFSFVMVGRLAGMIERTVWPDSDCLARPLGGATIDSRLDQRVY